MILTYMYVTFFLTQWISDLNSLQVNSIDDSRKSPYPTTMALVFGSRGSVQSVMYNVPLPWHWNIKGIVSNFHAFYLV